MENAYNSNNPKTYC
jgi:hypothetical protein